MLLEEYIKETQETITKILTMYDKMLKVSEAISLEYVSDEDSVEADVELTDADAQTLQIAVESSRESIKEISIGLKQALERSQELQDVTNRRKERIKQLDGRLYEQSTGEKVNIDEDQELRETYAPLLEGLTETEIQARLKQLKKLRG